ncbi:MAG: hypothetical protein HY242_07800 [Afipia sp.]|nr:hypothetical protein [Afipia sp.]
MNRAWAASLSNFWHSTNLPMWLTIFVAVVVVVVLVIVFFRAEGGMTKGAIVVLAVLGVGIGGFAFLKRGSAPNVQSASFAAINAVPERREAAVNLSAASQAPVPASLPALSCLDGIAGESVENACEKALFASADSTAAAVSYAAAQISRLAAFGSAASADKNMTPELKALRRTIERDRYGLVAQVLMTRDGCTSTACPFFQSVTVTNLISGNMNEKLYDGLVGRYSPFWNAPTPSAQAAPAAAAPGPAGPPPGRPLSGDFPSASSIPPVNIMTPEPGAQGTQSSPRQAESSPQPSRAPAPKKLSSQKSRAQAPTSLAPQRADDDN